MQTQNVLNIRFKWPFLSIFIENSSDQVGRLTDANADIMTIPIREPIKLNQDEISNQNVNPFSKCISTCFMRCLNSFLFFVCVCYPQFSHFNDRQLFFSSRFQHLKRFLMERTMKCCSLVVSNDFTHFKIVIIWAHVGRQFPILFICAVIFHIISFHSPLQTEWK